MNGQLEIFFALLIAHAICDYPLQGDFIGRFKSHKVDPPAGMPKTTWIHLLVAHSLIHAGGVWIVTGSCKLAFSEYCLHCVIDFAKCDGKTNLHIDQLLHVLCKIAFVVVISL